MPRKASDLFPRIASFPALYAAAQRAVRGKRRKPGAAAFMANLETELLRLERELLEGTWRSGTYKSFRVRDPKPRNISAAPFRDRVVQHALCAVVEPIFERGFIDHTFANRKGKGSHRAVACYEHYRDRYRYVLRCDIYRYFPAIDHAILKAEFRRRIACERTLALLDAIVDGSNGQEPVHRYFPGDDLFSPLVRRKGLPIGNLTSQFFANLYLDALDHFATEVLGAPYVRYVDDFALFADDANKLDEWRGRIERFLCGRRLLLHPAKSFVATTEDAALFLGYILLPGGYRRLPEANVQRFRGRLRGLRQRWRARVLGRAEVEQRVQAWIAHAEHACTWRLRSAIFRGGWFDPSIRLLPKPGGPLAASASCGAVHGTTIRGTCARRTATGTTRPTGTTTTGCASPVRSGD